MRWDNVAVRVACCATGWMPDAATNRAMRNAPGLIMGGILTPRVTSHTLCAG